MTIFDSTSIKKNRGWKSNIKSEINILRTILYMFGVFIVSIMITAFINAAIN